MSYNDSSPRSRGPPNGSKPGPNVRPTQEVRNGGPPNPSVHMTRAEKFEDEKRRIIESCFGKKEADGSSMQNSRLMKMRLLFFLSLVKKVPSNLALTPHWFISFRVIHNPHPSRRRRCTSVIASAYHPII